MTLGGTAIANQTDGPNAVVGNASPFNDNRICDGCNGTGIYLNFGA